jgi:DNA polymerase V
VGKGYARKLEEKGLYTMGDIARCSLGTAQDFHNEDLLYKLFGINAELLIDHAWGYEPCTMADIKAYKPERSSVGSGQVLHTPYTYEKAKLVVQEMTELLVLDLVEKQLLTNQIVLTVGYDIDNPQYHGDVTIDYYGRKVPKHAHGTENLAQYTSSARLIVSAMMQLYERIVDKNLMVRRVNLTAGNIIEAQKLAEPVKAPAQMSLFQEEDSQKTADETEALEKEKQLQQAVVALRQKFGKNAVLKGINLEEGATAQERNRQIGGHKA